MIQRKMLMSDCTEALLEDDIHINEVCMYILSRILNIGLGVVTRTDIWSTTQSDTVKLQKVFCILWGGYLYTNYKNSAWGGKN